MSIIKRILCPVDFSPFSERALRYGSALAARYESDLTVLSVRPRFLPPTTILTATERVESHLADDQELQSFVTEVVGPAAATALTTDGPVVQEILRVSAELPADLIVIGTHGASGFEHLLLGSVTEKVLRKAPCPVLTVPKLARAEAAAAIKFQTIICAVDFSPSSARTAGHALALAQESGGRLVLVHVLESFAESPPHLTAHFNVPEFRRLLEHDARQALDALIPEAVRTKYAVEVILGHGKASREVLRIAAERDADLIVLGVQGRGTIDLAMFGSTAQHVVRGATCPVLTVGPAGTTHGGRLRDDGLESAQAARAR